MLKLSTKFRYGFRILLYLAKAKENDFIPATTIAEKEDIAPRYLETILSSLLKTGWVISSRGAYGGYKLNIDLNELNLKQILDHFEGKSDFMHCIQQPSLCNRSNLCISRYVWLQIQKELESMTQKITLRDLIEINDVSEIKDLFKS